MEHVRSTSATSRRVPRFVRTALIAWTAVCLLLIAVAGVPAYRPAWSGTLRAGWVTHDLLVTEPLEPFNTPYISFARVRLPAPERHGDVRFVLVSGRQPIASRDALAARTLIALPAAPSGAAGPGEYGWNGRTASQFDPSGAVRVAVLIEYPGAVAASPLGPGAAVTIGYDGRSAAASVLHYWWPWMLGMFLLGAATISWPVTWAVQQRATALWRWPAVEHRPLIVLLAVSAALRIVLALRGGQYFDWDESRYVWGVRLFDLVSTGNLRAALELLLNSPDHPGFRVISLPLALFQVASAWPTGHAIAEPRYVAGEWLPACILSLASVCSIGLTYAIARRGGASRREAFVAAFLLAVSSATIMHARHFFPYDAAMATLLLAAWIGLGPGDSFLRSYIAGAIAGFGFLTYTGYWLLATVSGLTHLLRRPLSLRAFLLRAVPFALGGTTVVGSLIAGGLITCRPFFEAFVDTSRGILDGDFSEGSSLPWAYFWNVEGGVLLVYVAGIALAISHALRSGLRESLSGLKWVWCALAVYSGLVLGAHVLHQFVVYDRLARQMLPFMCLAAAAGLAPLEERRLGSTNALRVVQGVLVLLFAMNVLPFIKQRFPRELVADVMRTYGEAQVRLDTTIFNSVDATTALFLPVDPEQTAVAGARKRYVVLNARDIWMDDKLPGWKPPPRGEVLLRTPHPRQLRALQYQGYTPGQRLLLRHLDFSMQLIDTQAPGR